MSPTPLAYTPAQAAAMLGISRASLYRLLATSEIPSVVIGGRSRRIRHEALVDYLDRRQAVAS